MSPYSALRHRHAPPRIAAPRLALRPATQGNATFFLGTSKVNDRPENTIGSIPPIIVTFPREFPLALLAALVARAGYRIRWIRRGKVERAPL
jgi:hypothetical protein